MNLHEYDHVVVNSSGGKDSQTSLRAIVRLADTTDYPRDRITVVHADLQDMEWPGTKELAERQARFYSLRFVVVARVTKDGVRERILDYVERRGKWPDNCNRFCTSDFKRGPCQRLITQVSRELKAEGISQCRILNVFGFRAEESPARAKRKAFVHNKRASSKTRQVYDYLPIHDMTEDQVWADIHGSGVPHHQAYDLGMPRLSCCFCIFAPRAALIIAGKHNPALLDRYIETERSIGHTFRHHEPIAAIKDAIANNETPGATDGAWNM